MAEKTCRKTRHVGESGTPARPFPTSHATGGQALVEFAFAFPLQLLAMFAIMQLAMVYVAKQVVVYASYSAARAAMVAEDTAEASDRARRSAALICSPITGPTVQGSDYHEATLNSEINMIEVPGWGCVPKSGISSLLKTYVSEPVFSGDGEVTVSVTHYFELVFPVVDYAFSWLSGSGPSHAAGDMPDATGPGGSRALGGEAAFEESVGIWNVDAPHMRLRHTTTLSIPGCEVEQVAQGGLF